MGSIRLAVVMVAVGICMSCAARGQQQPAKNSDTVRPAPTLMPSSEPAISEAVDSAPTTAPKSLFDPEKHMHVSEVRPGMTGYGLSVFNDDKIERFDVQVISVLHNFNPQYDVVLIRCHGANLEHTGAIQGMSGSPIYLTDDHGRSRLIGAFAYGWPLMKDPVAGVQPIEYMLEVGSTLRPEAAATQQSGTTLDRTSAPRKLITYDPLHPLPKGFHLPGALAAPTNSNPFQMAGNGGAPQLQPLATPLMTSGLNSKLVEQFGPVLRQFGLVPLQSGGISGSSATTGPAPQIEPGSVLAAPLLTGDVEMVAIGTCTERIGDRIFGFGHPFNNEGPITLPMASGRINGIIANLSQSFKLGSMSALEGTLIADQAVGVAGKLGKAPPTIPIEVRVAYTDGSFDTTYHFNAAAHPRLTPVLTAMAVSAALSGRRDLPQYHTVHYDLNLEFDGHEKVEMKDVVVNTAGESLLQDLIGPLSLAADNPFERVMLRKVTGTIEVTPEAHEADILSVDLPKMKYHPGEMLKAFVRYRPFRSGESIMPIELQLPHDLKNGKYQLSVSDQENYISDEEEARPFRFKAENIEDIFNVLRDVSSIQKNALYVRLLRHADGVAVGRTALPLLPSSRRQVLLEAGRSNISAYVSSAVKVIPTEIVMNGSADFEIEIDAEDRVEVGGRAPRPSEQRSPQATNAPAAAGTPANPAPAKGKPNPAPNPSPSPKPGSPPEVP